MKELQPPPTHRETFRVRCRETDRNGLLKLSSWFDFLQEAAANHAAQLGVGLEALSERGLLWVLSRLHLSIRRYPAIGESVTVETWPNGFRRLFAHRQFRLTFIAFIVRLDHGQQAAGDAFNGVIRDIHATVFPTAEC